MVKSHLLFLILFLISSSVFADAECLSVTAGSSDHTRIVVEQRVFDGVRELAIVGQDARVKSKINRLSFSGSKEAGCHFPVIAILNGGDWGWHVAWTSSANQGVFYARVDGEAWVSSLPKRLARDVAEQVTFTEINSKLLIIIKYPESLNLPEHRFASDDEGRSWAEVTP